MTAAIAFVVGGIIWLLVFDMWLGQVERQYLYAQARAELGFGERVSLKAVMDQGVHDGGWIATGWALLVVTGIALAAFYGYRRGRADRDTP